MTVDYQANAVYVWMDAADKANSARQQSIGDSVIVDWNENGELIGVEILLGRVAS